MARLVAAGEVDHVERANNVSVYILARMIKAVAHAGLCSKVEDDVWLNLVEHALHHRAIFHAVAGEAKVREGGKARGAVFFQLHVIIGGEGIDAGDRMAFAQQSQRNFAADETGRPGDDDVHVLLQDLFTGPG